jgi:hypothetical protein
VNEGDDQIGSLALRTGLLAADRWREAREAWLRDGRSELGAFLAARGDLTPRAVEVLRALASELKPVHPSSQPTLVAPSSAARGGGRAVVLTQPPHAKFTLGAELGRGGLGRVVEAHDADLGRTVALKLLLDSADPAALERFRKEARVAGRLEHPNIVPVHGMGILPESREVYLCMKKVAGRDMALAIRAGKWSLRRLVESAACAVLENVEIPWDPQWPIFSVTWKDGQLLARHRSRRLGFLFHQPHEDQWERPPAAPTDASTRGARSWTPSSPTARAPSAAPTTLLPSTTSPSTSPPTASEGWPATGPTAA